MKEGWRNGWDPKHEKLHVVREAINTKIYIYIFVFEHQVLLQGPEREKEILKSQMHSELHSHIASY